MSFTDSVCSYLTFAVNSAKVFLRCHCLAQGHYTREREKPGSKIFKPTINSHICYSYGGNVLHVLDHGLISFQIQQISFNRKYLVQKT